MKNFLNVLISYVVDSGRKFFEYRGCVIVESKVLQNVTDYQKVIEK